MNAWSIDEHYLATEPALLPGHVDNSENAVARRLWLGADNGQLLADQGIEECGFAGVGATQNAEESGMKGHKWFS